MTQKRSKSPRPSSAPTSILSEVLHSTLLRVLLVFVVLVVVVIIVVAFIEGRSITFWPPAIGAIPTSALLTPTPAPLASAPTIVAIAPAAKQTFSEQTGPKQTYSVVLTEGETIVGHGDAIQGLRQCVAFILSGPGTFVFSIENGIYYRWQYTNPQADKMLLEDQVDILVSKYQCKRDAIQFYRQP